MCLYCSCVSGACNIQSLRGWQVHCFPGSASCSGSEISETLCEGTCPIPLLKLCRLPFWRHGGRADERLLCSANFTMLILSQSCCGNIQSIFSRPVIECCLGLIALLNDCGAFSVPCCVFSFTIGTFVCFCVVFNDTFFGSVSASTAEATSLGLSTMHCHMSKSMTLKALGVFSVILKKLAVVS